MNLIFETGTCKYKIVTLQYLKDVSLLIALTNDTWLVSGMGPSSKGLNPIGLKPFIERA